MHTDPAPETTEQEVVVTEQLPSANVDTEVTDVVVIAPDMDDSKETEAVSSDIEVDIADTKVNWLGTEPVLKIDPDMVSFLSWPWEPR